MKKETILSFIGQLCFCENMAQVADEICDLSYEIGLTEIIDDIDFDDGGVTWDDFSMQVLKNLSKLKIKNFDGESFSDIVSDIDNMNKKD